MNKLLSLFLVCGILLITGCKKKDTGFPEIILNGSTDISLILNAPWNEPGYSASDDRDGDITTNVVVSGSVNIDFAGTYILKYTVTDFSGNETSVSRKITVYNEARFLSGDYTAFDTCLTSGISYTTSITPSNYINKEFFIENFGGWNAICSCNAVIKMNVSGTTVNSILSWNTQLIAGNDSLIESANGGAVSGLTPTALAFTYLWKNGSSTETCTSLYTYQ